MRPLIALALLGPAASWAQLTPQQAISVQHIGEVSFAPDSQHVAFTVEAAPKGKSSSRNIWVGNGAELASAWSSSGADYDPQWSPDGRRIAYLSAGGGAPELYTASSRDDLQPLTHHGAAIEAFHWSPDGKFIAFIAADADSTRAESKQDPRIIKVVSGSDLPAHLWVIDTASRRERQVTTGTFNVSEFAWRPDGSGFIVLASERPDPDHASARIYAVDGRSGSSQQLLDPKVPIEQLELSPDGDSIAYVGPHASGATPSDLYLMAVSGGAPRDLTFSIDRGIAHYVWKDRSTLIASFEFGFINRLFSVSTSGASLPLSGFDANPSSFDVSPSGAIAFVSERASDPPELYLRTDSHAASRPLTALNRQWHDIPRAQGELIRYTSFDGTPIEGQLLRPPGSTAERLPTILWLHGGPIGRWEDRFDPEGQFLASHGYAVFYPNIRGSRGYGQHLIDLVRSTARGGSGWADGTLKDIEAAADALVQRGVADPDRLGVGGWSAGGYFAGLAVTRSTRFKAAVGGSGFYDMLTDLGTEISSFVPGDTWAYGNFFDPATQLLLHQDSPIATVKDAHTPILLLHGEFDRTDTIGQVYEFYRALQTYGAPVRLVVYPRDGHSFREEAHIIDQLGRTLAWYDNYLKGLGNDGSARQPR